MSNAFSIKHPYVSSYLQKHDQGQVLLDIVFKHLDLTERDYFGLQLADEPTDNPVSQIYFINHDINLICGSRALFFTRYLIVKF